MVMGNSGKKISVRFNNKDTDGSTKWVLIVDDVVNYVSEVKINIPIFTETIFIEGVGLKHHLSGYADTIVIFDNIAYVTNQQMGYVFEGI